jgi:A/G-specific adenine glycosylase
LPGIGRSTAAAIAVFAFGERAAILDGNAKRVLARCFGTEEHLWPLAERLLPRKNIEAYTQALMDLGATVCSRRPTCGKCPVKGDCVAAKTGRIGELPAPRRRRVLPLKETTWFVYLRDGKVLLERRPAAGIWGGLWCFPEVQANKTRVVRRLPAIDHGFTHFRLQVQPLLCDAPRTAGRWMDIAKAIAAAVPAPVRKLLEELRSAAQGARARRAVPGAPASSRGAKAGARQGAS